MVKGVWLILFTHFFSHNSWGMISCNHLQFVIHMLVHKVYAIILCNVCNILFVYIFIFIIGVYVCEVYK